MSVKYYKKDEVDRLYTDAKAHLIRRWEPRPGYKPLILTTAREFTSGMRRGRGTWTSSPSCTTST